MDARIGRSIRVLRQRRGWRQVDLAARSGVSQSAISDMECGRLDRYTLAITRRVLRALDADATLAVRWGAGGDLDRLLDAAHADLVQAWAVLHHRAGWEVWTEASFSIFGERGRIDLLAFHRPTATLEVVEAKTGIWDVQDIVGRLDAKIRLGPRIAADRGWRPRRVVGALIVLDGRTARRRVAQYPLLFERLDARGRAATAFVRDPRRPATGLLAFVALPRTTQDRLRRPGQQRVRRSPVGASVAAPIAIRSPRQGAAQAHGGW